MKKAYLMGIACVFMIAMVSIPGALCYPLAGTDTMNPTTATIELEITGLFTETLDATGPTTVNRSNPYDPGDGRMMIDTEIVSMNLAGTSLYIGNMVIAESPTKTSNGTIRQWWAGFDFPADSFFDVFVEIQTVLLPPVSILHNDDPVLMNTVIYAIPPEGSLYGSLTGSVPLKDMNDNVIGFIKHVYHKIGTGGIPIGGVSVRIDMLSKLAPYVGLTSAIVVATVVTGVCGKRVKREREKK